MTRPVSGYIIRVYFSRAYGINPDLEGCITQKSNAGIGTRAAHCFCVHLFSMSIICRTLENVNKNIENPIFYWGGEKC